MLDLDPFTPLEEVTQGSSKSQHKSATNAFPHITVNTSKPGRAPQNSWYHEECWGTRKIRIYTHKKAITTFQHLMRKEIRFG